MISTPAMMIRAATSSASCPATSSVDPQGEFGVRSVVGVGVGDVPQRGLGLGGDEVRVGLHGEHRLRGVGDLPDHDRGDLDGVAVPVVDLQDVRLEVPDPGGHGAAPGQRPDPDQPGAPHGAGVAAEELQDRGLPGLHHHDRRHHHQGGDGGERTAGDPRRGQGRIDPAAPPRRSNTSRTAMNPLPCHAGRSSTSTRMP